jgi:hypothetical protein
MRLLTLWLLLQLANTSAQTPTLPNFVLPSTPPTVQHNTQLLGNAWAGGLNNPQFSTIDFDNNGTLDLFVFDRSTNRVLTFINNNTPNQTSYQFAPQYAAYFPANMHDWAILTDLNHDGLNDLITYGVASIQYYTASRQPNNTLLFSLVTTNLRFVSNGTPTPIPANPVDIPAFVDVNKDGDLDILQFDFIGKYMEYYENQSIENTGTPSSNEFFLLADACWGKFSEDSNSNSINLNDNCTGGYATPTQDAKLTRHSGSSVLPYDFNNDNLLDLLIGDVSHRNLVQLLNNGTPSSALITQLDLQFPTYNQPIDLYIFPQPFMFDANNDQLLDLVVATNEKRSQTFNHISWHQNTNTNANPVFEWQTNAFLVDDMIDVGVRSYPTFVDYNADGLLDLFIGNLGTFDTTTQQYNNAALTLYQNVGSNQQPNFELISTNYSNLANLAQMGLYPAFADLDNDGDTDLLAGDEAGNLHYFTSTAAPNEPLNLQLQQANFISIANADAAVPCLFDINNDQKPDLIVGEKAGKLSYYLNTTIGNTLSFALQSSFWGNVDVRTLGSPFGYSAPAIGIFNTDTLLFVASESGRVFVYNNLQSATFNLLTDSLTNINQGGRGGLALAQAINQNYWLAIGSNRGGLAFNTAQINHVGIAQSAPNTPISAFVQQNTAYLQGLSIGKQYVFMAYNLLGKPIMQQTFWADAVNHQISLPPNLPNGIYLGRLTTSNNQQLVGFKWINAH